MVSSILVGAGLLVLGVSMMSCHIDFVCMNHNLIAEWSSCKAKTCTDFTLPCLLSVGIHTRSFVELGAVTLIHSVL